MYIAHISDTHFIKDNPATLKYARRIVDTINGFEILPKFVVVTGDLVNEANWEDYDLCFCELNRLKAPYYVIGGNHDKASVLAKALKTYYPDHPKSEISGYLQYSVDIDDLRVIAVDFYGDRQDGYMTDTERLDWLEDKLEATPAGKNVVIIKHRFPLNTHLHFFAKRENPWYERFAEIVSLYKNKVKLIACGHLHNSLMGNIGGVPIVSTLSPFGLLNMDFQKAEPLVREDRDFLAFHVHLIDDGVVTSYLVPIDMVVKDGN
ncbi:MAG: metallophosphoesterase [Lactobacillaceae bacterium]|jgi:3',5'-cyclic AMP phosphodiesterase CpdA|nr:metallophosphoesterase [Lactobacillaceae bacterium]